MSNKQKFDQTIDPTAIFESIKWVLEAWLDQLSCARLETLIKEGGPDLNALMIAGAKERLSQMGYYYGHC